MNNQPARYLGAVLLLAVTGLLVACAAKPPKPEPARMQFVVAADANPDSSNRASPLVVRVFQLRGADEFSSADFFALYDKEKETLGASLISREEYVLVPGETRKLELAVNAEARFLGAIGAFRDIRSAQWRAVTKAPDKKLTDLLKKDGVTITVQKDSLALAVRD